MSGRAPLRIRKSRRTSLLVLLAPYLYAIHLTATNQGVLAFGAGVVAVGLYRNRFAARLAIAACAGVMLWALGGIETASFLWGQIHRYGTEVPKLRGYAATAEMYADTPLLAVVGTGPGSYGSRAAVARSSPEDLGKPQGSKIPEAFVQTPAPLKRYLAQFYDPDYVDQVVRAGVSGTYYTPFSTWNAVFGELGLIGAFVLLLVLWRVLRRSLDMAAKTIHIRPLAYTAAVSCIALAILFSYENWLEYPKLMVPFALFVGQVNTIR